MANANNADAQKKGSETNTIEQERELWLNKLAEEGKFTALNRILLEWKTTGDTKFEKGTMFDKDIVISEDAYFGRMATQDILKITALS